MTKFEVAITTDTICPYCYLGEKKLDKGIAAYKAKHPGSKDTFDIVYRPFQLNPNAPSPGMNKRDYYIMRFGPVQGQIKHMYPGLPEAGRSMGINFSFNGKTGNTRDSHRIVYLAKAKHDSATQQKVVAALAKMYFEEEGDITDPAELTKAAVSAGLGEKEVQGWLASDEGGEEVDEEVIAARKRGVSGVPNFVLQGKYNIGGSQEPEEFVSLFERIKESEGQ